MPIKAKYNGSYKDITDLMNVDESIDYVLAKTSSSYKRVYTATRSIEDTPPTTFKSIKPGANLTDYRIYGQTSRNLFDMKTFAETCNQVYGTVNYINNTLTFTATNGVDAYVNSVYNKGAPFYVGERPSCIDVLPSTTYTISMSSAPKCYISWVNSSYEVVSAYTQIPANQKSYTFTTPSNCTKLLIRLGKEVTNIGDTFTISDIMLNSGSTPLPYEPYGESVGDRTGNLFDKSQFIQSNLVLRADSTYIVEDPYTISTILPCKPNTKYTITKIITNRFIIWGCENYPVAGGNGNGYIVLDYNATSLTFTTGSNDNFLLVMLFYKRQPNDPTVEDVKNNLMYNYGEMCPYEPYGYKVPVTVEGKNLFDENYPNIDTNNKFKSIYVGDGTFTLSTNYPLTAGSTAIYFLSGEITGGVSPSAALNGVWDGHNKTISSENGYVTIVYRILNNVDPRNYWLMLNKGTTPLPYEPYHAPVTTPIYLPEPIKMVGDEAEYIDYGEQKFVKKFYELTLNFDDMNNNETYPGWSGGTAVVEYCNKIRSLATDSPNSYIPIQYSSISNFTAIFNVSSNNSILYLGNSRVIGHTQSELKEIYAGQSITFILKMPDTELDVTLPALPTVTGTNVLSVSTEVQPSKIDITGHIKTISGGS